MEINLIPENSIIKNIFVIEFLKSTSPSQINLSDTLKKLYVYLYDF